MSPGGRIGAHLTCRRCAQNDHFADGSFPIPHSADVVPVINNLRAREWDLVVFVKTEHSVNHSAFCSNNPVRAWSLVASG